MNSMRKVLIIGDVPKIFISAFKSLFHYFQMYFIDLDKESSGDRFCLRVYSLQPAFVMIRLDDYLKNKEFYDYLMKSFQQSIFWKIDTNKVWREEDIKNTLRQLRRDSSKRR